MDLFLNSDGGIVDFEAEILKQAQGIADLFGCTAEQAATVLLKQILGEAEPISITGP